MTWQDHLTKQERAELARAAAKRYAARKEFNATRLRLKARCDARARRKKAGVLRGKEESDGL